MPQPAVPMLRAVAALAMLIAFLLAHVPPAAAQSSEDRALVLAVNDEFYRAFRESDLEAMQGVWGEEEPIGLQHPAWPRPVVGRERVMMSWTHILRSPPDISCEIESVAERDGRWAVICNEILNPGSVRMINLFQREKGEWKMIYHGLAPAGTPI